MDSIYNLSLEVVREEKNNTATVKYVVYHSLPWLEAAETQGAELELGNGEERRRRWKLSTHRDASFSPFNEEWDSRMNR